MAISRLPEAPRTGMMQRWMHRCSSPTTFEKWFASNCTSANVKPYFHLQEISAQRGAGTASVLRFIPSADRLCQPSLNGITNADCFREADLSGLIFERIAKEPVSQPECHVYESDQDRNLDQRPHNSNECLARVQAEYGNRYFPPLRELLCMPRTLHSRLRGFSMTLLAGSISIQRSSSN
jgi:hypothetical protein